MCWLSHEGGGERILPRSQEQPAECNVCSERLTGEMRRTLCVCDASTHPIPNHPANHANIDQTNVQSGFNIFLGPLLPRCACCAPAWPNHALCATSGLETPTVPTHNDEMRRLSGGKDKYDHGTNLQKTVGNKSNAISNLQTRNHFVCCTSCICCL